MLTDHPLYAPRHAAFLLKPRLRPCSMFVAQMCWVREKTQAAQVAGTALAQHCSARERRDALTVLQSMSPGKTTSLQHH